MAIGLELFFHNRLKQYCDDRIAMKTQELIDGNARDYAEYRDAAGYIRAMREVLAEAEQLRISILES
jgi:hypothetical protein